jgi:hypothetical protein
MFLLRSYAQGLAFGSDTIGTGSVCTVGFSYSKSTAKWGRWGAG